MASQTDRVARGLDTACDVCAKSATYQTLLSDTTRSKTVKGSRCIAHLANGKPCGEPAARNHSIGRSVHLDRLAVEGQVLALAPDREGHSIEKEGIGRATTFRSFCTRHDTTLFRAIDCELEAASVGNTEASALHLRSVAFSRDYAFAFARRGSAFLSNARLCEPCSLGMREETQVVRETERILTEALEEFQQSREIALFAFSAAPIEFACSYATILNRGLVVSINVLPGAGTSTTVVSAADSADGRELLDALASGTTWDLTQQVSEWICRYSHNWVLSPRVGLAARDELLRFFEPRRLVAAPAPNLWRLQRDSPVALEDE